LDCRPPDPEDPTGALHGNATTCACSQWSVLTVYDDSESGGGGGGGSPTTIQYCGVGPGWKPSAETLAAGKPGRANPNPFAEQWTAVPFVEKTGAEDEDGSGVVSLEVDLSPLEGRKPLAVRLGWPLFKIELGSADDMCCVHAASQSHMNGLGGGLAPCVPGNCPVSTTLTSHSPLLRRQAGSVVKLLVAQRAAAS
jgi:hypothetical protein